jgi:multidrug efflux pump subunit AcrA (membrane-fusion protein)
MLTPISGPGQGLPADHNQPPEDADPFLERLEKDHEALADQAADLELEALSLPEKVDTEEDAAKVTNFVAKAKKLTREAEKKREEEKEPWLVRGRKVDAFFKRLSSPVLGRITRLEADLNAYARAKAARERAEREARERAEREAAEARRREEEAARQAAERAAQEAEAAAARIRSAADAEERAAAEAQMREAEQEAAEQRRAAEAAAKAGATATRVADAHGKAAAGPVGKLSKTTAEGGSTTTSTFWTHRIADQEKLIASCGVLGPHLTLDAITSAVAVARRKAVAAGTIADLEIPGVEFFEDVKTNVTVAKPKT